MRFSACIEVLFAKEAPVFPDRIRLARDAGLDAVEFWWTSNKDVDAVKAALDETGLPLAGAVVETTAHLTGKAAHPRFLELLDGAIKVAQRLGTKVLVAQGGANQSDLPRPTQHAAIVAGLTRAADRLKGTGIVLAIEPLNTLVDHKSYYLSSTTEGLDIVDEVGRPEIGLTYDIYHSAVMGEDVEKVLAGRLDRVAHVHLADMPGREPGSGKLDWRAKLAWLDQAGYRGYIGLEFWPTKPTREALAFLAEA
jgi:hydroxypyruvate isomerase